MTNSRTSEEIPRAPSSPAGAADRNSISHCRHERNTWRGGPGAKVVDEEKMQSMILFTFRSNIHPAQIDVTPFPSRSVPLQGDTERVPREKRVATINFLRPISTNYLPDPRTTPLSNAGCRVSFSLLEPTNVPLSSSISSSLSSSSCSKPLLFPLSSRSSGKLNVSNSTSELAFPPVRYIPPGPRRGFCA